MSISLERIIGLVLLLPWGVTWGVEVLRGVRVGLGGDVGEGVQVGSMRLRGFPPELIGVGRLGVCVDGAAGAAQPASKMLVPNRMSKLRFTTCLPSVCELTAHSFPARQPTVG